MNTGIYCDIKRYAIHDGPGIRTTLFLKGCPLHCVWCHNPETISPESEIALRKNKCINCGECASACPQNVHVLRLNGHLLSRKKCTGCGKCDHVCYYNALAFYGRKITVDEAFTELIKDREFFEESGGGVTLSGGEPMLQAEFTLALLKKLHENKISTALDTCCFTSWKNLESALPYTDFFLCDFKHADPLKHKEYTGQSNELIKENLLKLGAAGAQIEIRIPLIPGLNTDPENLNATGMFLAQIPTITAVRLLPYHALARSKYEALGRPDTMPAAETPTSAELDEMAKILRQYGLKTICPDD